MQGFSSDILEEGFDRCALRLPACVQLVAAACAQMLPHFLLLLAASDAQQTAAHATLCGPILVRARYQGIIRDLPLGLGRNPRHNNSLGWLDSLSDDELAARLLFEQQDGQAATGSAGQTAGAASRDELAVADGTAGAGAAGRGKRCHLVRTIEVSVTSSDQVCRLGGAGHAALSSHSLEGSMLHCQAWFEGWLRV